MSIGTKLKALRAAKKVTQQQAAELFTTVRRWLELEEEASE